MLQPSDDSYGDRSVGRVLVVALSALAIVVVAALSVGYLGLFSVAADTPHSAVTSHLFAFIRDRSIEVRASGLVVPDLADSKLVELGARHYAEMCTDCHSAPGAPESEIRLGLNPQPPNLSRAGPQRAAAEQFWIIKHGIKMSAMPAWGATHDDHSIWGLVAFVRRLPTLDAAAYAVLAESNEGGGHDGHQHTGDSDPEAATPSGPSVSGESATASHSEHAHEHADEHKHAH